MLCCGSVGGSGELDNVACDDDAEFVSEAVDDDVACDDAADEDVDVTDDAGKDEEAGGNAAVEPAVDPNAEAMEVEGIVVDEAIDVDAEVGCCSSICES